MHTAGKGGKPASDKMIKYPVNDDKWMSAVRCMSDNGSCKRAVPDPFGIDQLLCPSRIHADFPHR